MSWQDYCDRIEDYLDAARLNQIMASKPGGWLKEVRLASGEFADSEETCLKILLQGFSSLGKK